jgi:hypothetical protein
MANGYKWENEATKYNLYCKGAKYPYITINRNKLTVVYRKETGVVTLTYDQLKKVYSEYFVHQELGLKYSLNNLLTKPTRVLPPEVELPSGDGVVGIRRIDASELFSKCQPIAFQVTDKGSVMKVNGITNLPFIKKFGKTIKFSTFDNGYILVHRQLTTPESAKKALKEFRDDLMDKVAESIDGEAGLTAAQHREKFQGFYPAGSRQASPAASGFYASYLRGYYEKNEGVKEEEEWLVKQTKNRKLDQEIPIWRIVAKAWIDNTLSYVCDDDYDVAYRDGDYQNLCPSNLLILPKPIGKLLRKRICQSDQ